jgi:hypothetical protein
MRKMKKYLLQNELIIYLGLLEVWEELGVSLVKSITVTWLELEYKLENDIITLTHWQSVGKN